MPTDLRVIDGGSYYNTWGDNTTKIPGGVILGVSVVVFNKQRDVYVSALSIIDGKLSVVLSRAGKEIAWGSTTSENSTLFLDTAYPCCSAQIMVGSLSGINLKKHESITLKPWCVLTVPEPAKHSTVVNITQDGVTESVLLNRDYVLKLDRRFTADYSEESKTVTISLNEENHRELLVAYSQVEPGISRILTINNVKPDAEGVVNLTIRSNAGELEFDINENAPMLTISSNLSPCISEDVIDRYISPALIRSFSYMPLDDAYDKIKDEEDEEDESFVRDTVANLSSSNNIDPVFDPVVVDPVVDPVFG